MVHLWFSFSEQKTPISANDKPEVEQDKSDHVTPGVPVTPQEAEEGKKVFDAKVTLKSVNIKLRVKGTFGSFSLLFSTVTFCIFSLKRKLQHLLSFDAPVSESFVTSVLLPRERNSIIAHVFVLGQSFSNLSKLLRVRAG